MTQPLARTIRDIDYLGEAWPHLVVLRTPGTARSWVETPRRTGVLTETDLDRMGKKGVPRPTPADVGVLDLLAMVADRADDVARTIIGVCGLGDDPANPDLTPDDFLPDRSAAADPRPWLRVAAAWLAAAHELDGRTGPWVERQLRPVVTQAARLLGDVRDGQVMNGVCPWCEGRSAGGTGERTLQIHYPAVDDENDEPLIICFGVGCMPPSASCGVQWRGHPAWPRREWDWLSTQLRTTVDEAPAVVEVRRGA